MRLKTLDIRGFGQLRGIVDLETGRGTVALLLERNEAGKSTLAAAITAALYGLDGNRTRHRNRMTPLDRHRPWKGGAYGLELILDRNGHELRITRDFEQGVVEVRDGTRDITAEFRRGKNLEVGEVLTGLTRAQFELSAFVPQGKIVWEDASSLAEALQRAADSQSGESTAAAAIEVLDSSLDQYVGLTLKKGKAETEVQRCEEEAAQAIQDLAALDERRAALDTEIDQLRRMESEEEESRVRREALRLRRAATELEFEAAALNADDERRTRHQQLQTRLAEDPALERLTEDVRRELGTERRRHGILLSKLEGFAEELRETRKKIHDARAQLESMPLQGVPSPEQVTELYAWVHTRNELRLAREQLLSSLERERSNVTRAGFDPATAAILGERFGGLTERDRALLGGLRKRRLELDDESDRARQRLDAASVELGLIAADQDRRRRIAMIVVWVGVALAVAGVVGARFAGLQLWLGSIPGAVVLAAGVYLALSAGHHRAGAEFVARAREEEQEAELGRLDSLREELQDQLAVLAGRLGCSPDELEESWRAWLDLQPHTSGLSVYEERLAGLDADQTRLVGSLEALAPILGSAPSLEDLDGFYDLLRGAREVADAIVAAQGSAAELTTRIDRQQAEIGESEQALRERLREFGVEPGPDLEEAFERFEERAARAIELAQIRERELPQLERQIAPPPKRAEREERVEGLSRRLREGRPAVERDLVAFGEDGAAILTTLDDPLSEEELQAELRALEAAIELRHDASTRQLTEVRSFIERYEREAPALRDRIEELDQAARRAREFSEAVGLARDTLDVLAEQTHQLWSTELAAHTNQTLQAMGSEIGEVEFDDQLNLSLVQRGQRMSGAEARQALSTGARDLLHLGCRIALAHFLSGGDLDLPLILDDPFAHCDDPRTIAGMKVLADSIAPEHQVILLACQRNRYEWVRQQIDAPHRIRTLGLEDRA